MQEKRNRIISTCAAGGLSAALLVLFFLFVFVFGTEETGYPVREEQAGEMSAAGGILAFTAEIYEVQANQEMDMSRYLRCEGMSAEDVIWSSDSKDLTVGSKGHIAVNGYGLHCRLVVFSKSDENIRAECVIKSGTEEEESAYQIGMLNGEDTGDEMREDGTVRLAYPDDKDGNGDIKYEKRTPGEKNEKYTWNQELFYTLEEIDPDSDKDGQITSYLVEKKKFAAEDTENEVEYEIYRNPDTNKVNKIVSIEFQKRKLAVTEYYYTDKGRVNFVFSYQDVNYTPSYAAPDREGERYLYHNDTMVTWRIAKDGRVTNYCYGEAEKKRLNDSGYSDVRLYAECSEKKKKQYDKKEQEMLNAAYNAFDAASNREGISVISGYLYDASGEGLQDAEVVLRHKDSSHSLCTVFTDKEGYYQITVPSRQADYELRFAKEDFIDEILYGIQAGTDEVNLSQEAVYLSKKDEDVYECELSFYDALNKSESENSMAVLNEPVVVIRRGVNNRSGASIYDERISGYRQKISLAPGMYTIQVRREGYIDTCSSLFVSGETGNALAVYAVPKLQEEEYRIVLTWNEKPGDLDSHLFVPSGSMPDEDYHICYYHMSDSSKDVSLDVDDMDGYGPETTTIKNIRHGQYKFYVCDFTNCAGNNEKSRQMSESSAAVRVYGKKGLIQTFHVPTHRSGVIWEVFEIRDGTMIPSQRYYDAVGNKKWWRADKE